MNWPAVMLLIKHEFRMLLRDRRTVVLAFLLPVIMAPVILFGIKFMGEWRKEKLDETVYTYSIVGSYADSVRAMIHRGRMLQETDNAGTEKRLFSFKEMTTVDPDSSLATGDLHFFLRADDGVKADSIQAEEISREEKTGSEDSADSVKNVVTVRYPGVPIVTIYFMGNRDGSRTGRSRIQNLIIDSRTVDRQGLLQQHGFTIEPTNIITLSTLDLATREQVAGSNFGRFITLFLMILTLSGATVVAMDSIAGEKERGSLETLLTTSVSHMDIISAKQMTILIVALGIVLIQVANLLIYVTLGYINLPNDIIGALPPQALVTLLFLYIPVAIVISSLLLMVSAFAKSYKETQFYYLPVFFTLCVLSAAAFLPSISLGSFIVLVPIANVSVAIREVMVGMYNWPMLFTTCFVMIATAMYLLYISSRMLSMEKLITTQDTDEADLLGGAALFPKRVLIWFVGMWVLLFTIPANIPALANLEGQYLFNMFGVFLGVSVLMIRVYRLDWRQALAIRPVRPVVWIVILVLIPVSQITGTGVITLANEIFPFPEELLEEFVRQIIPEEFPLWKVLLMISITPGIVEEMAFRGVLLHGLHRRLRPILLVLVIGGIFGLFHTSLFRIIPTGYLGMILTSVAVLTGSIFPCMLLHAGNNAFAIILYHYGIQMDQLTWHYYVMSVLLFAGSFYMLYRFRTPYPNLLPMKKRQINSE